MTYPMRRSRYGPRRFDPFAGVPGFDGMYDQMSRMLTSAFPDVARISINSWSPPVDIHESAQGYTVEADLPGVRPDDVTVDLQGRELRITGEYGSTNPTTSEQTTAELTTAELTTAQQATSGHAIAAAPGEQAQQGQASSSGQQQAGQQQTGQHGSRGGGGRRSGRFDYRVTLPAEVRSEDIVARLEHGVLLLSLPKLSSGDRRRIPIQSGEQDQGERRAPSSPDAAGTGTDAGPETQ